MMIKRILTSFFALTVFLTAVNVVKAEAVLPTETYGENLLEGGSFETAAAGPSTSTQWQPYYNWNVAFGEIVSGEADTENVYSGNRAIRFTNTGLNNGVKNTGRGLYYSKSAELNEAASEGETYCFSGYFRTDDPNGTQLGAQLLKNTWAPTSSGEVFPTLTTKWQEIKFYATIPAGGSFDNIRLSAITLNPDCVSTNYTGAYNYASLSSALNASAEGYCIYADNLQLRRVYKNSVPIGMSGDAAWFISEAGELWTYDSNSPKSPEKIMEDVSMAAEGGSHTAVLSRNGSLYTKGDNEWGQLGDGTFVNKTEFVKVCENVKKVVCGDDFTLVLKNNGEIYSAGKRIGAFNVGTGATTQNEFTFVASDAKDVYAAPGSIFVLYNDDTLYAGGDNGYGQLGCGGYLPQYLLIKVMDNVKKVSAEREYTLILTNDNKMYGCGWNLYGQLGDTLDGTDTPVLLREGVTDISASRYAALALDSNGQLNAVGGGDVGFINGKNSITSVVSGGISALYDNGAAVSSDGGAYVFDNGLKPVGQAGAYVTDYVYDGTVISGRVYCGEEKATLIIAQYLANGRFNGVSLVPYETKMNNVINFDVKINRDTSSVKIMLFRDIVNIEPVMSCYTKDLTVN